MRRGIGLGVGTALLLVVATCGREPAPGGGPGESASATVGRDGGRIEFGALTLEVPEDALERPTTITVRQLEEAPWGTVGAAYDFGPDGLRFAVPARLTIAYDEDELPPGTPAGSLAVRVREGGRWVPLDGGEVNVGAGTVSALVSHFSIFGIGADPAADGGAGMRWEANGVVAESSAEVVGRLYVSTDIVTLLVDGQGTAAADLVLSGLPVDAPVYVYLDTHEDERVLGPADGGTLSLHLDLDRPRFVWMQFHHSTTGIGGPNDMCTNAGVDGVRVGNTCTLTHDLTGTVEIGADDQVLDCAGHSIAADPAAVGEGFGIRIVGWHGVEIRDCVVGGPGVGFSIGLGAELSGWLADGSALTVTNCTFADNYTGVRLEQVRAASVRDSAVLRSWRGVEVASKSEAVVFARIRIEPPAVAVTKAIGFSTEGFVGKAGVLYIPQGCSFLAGDVEGVGTGVALGMSREIEIRDTDLAGVGTGLLVRDGATVGSDPTAPPEWSHRFWHNNVQATTVGVSSPVGPLEVSWAAQGSFWNHSCPGPLFAPGVDSNRADVVDGYAYGGPDAWISGAAPGCAPPDSTPPDPPVLRSPAESDVVYSPMPALIGTAEPNAVVAVYEATLLLGTSLASGRAEFAVAPGGPLALGTHTVFATATDVSGNVSLPSAPRTFVVRPVSESSPLVGAAGRLQVVSLTDFPDALEPGLGQNHARVEAKVDPVAGLGGGSPNHRFLALLQRSIQDPSTGTVLKTTLGFTEIPNVAATGGDPVPVTISDYWCGTDGTGSAVPRGQAYPYDLSVKVVRQYVGSGRGPRCSRGEMALTTGPGSPACVVDSLDVADVGVVNVAVAAPGTEPLPSFCFPDLLMLTDKARAQVWPASVYPRRYFTGAIGNAWGEDLVVGAAAAGCDAGALEDRAACLLGATSAFGISVPARELRHVDTDVTELGERIVRFQQVLQRWDVLGSQVVVTMGEDGTLREVFSHFIPDIRVVNSAEGDFAEDFAAFDEPGATAAILAELGRRGEVVDPPPTIRFEGEYVYVNHGGGDPAGRLAVWGLADVAGPSAATHGCLLDLRDLTILDYRPGQVFEHAKVEGGFAQVTFSDRLCAGDADCGPDLDHCLYDTFDGPRCADMCNDATDAACALAFGDGWSCTPGSYWDSPFWCEKAVTEWPHIGLGVYDRARYADGWPPDTFYSYYLPYRRLAEALDDLAEFFNTDLGRRGWDDPPVGTDVPAPFWTYVCPSCRALAPPSHPQIEMPLFTDRYDRSIDVRVRGRRDLAHEWTHQLVSCQTAACAPCHPCRHPTGTGLSADCLAEGIADLYGALFAVRSYGGSSDGWTNTWTCGGGAGTGLAFHESPWMDWPQGLHRCFARRGLPYALRSRFDCSNCGEAPDYDRDPCVDALSCLPYEDCSGTPPTCTNQYTGEGCNLVWNRFARILTEGPDTFRVDGTGEDIGMRWEPLGLGGPGEPGGTIDVVYGATQRATGSSRLFDWVDSLMAAAVGRLRARDYVRFALGAIGFLGVNFPVLSGVAGSEPYASDLAPSATLFQTWTRDPRKDFFAWRDPMSRNIRLAYAADGRTVVKPLGGLAADAPALVEYNGVMHLFWQDRSTGQLMGVYYTADGRQAGPFSLSAVLGIAADAGVDAVVFQNSLYLVYTTAGGTLTLSRCTITEGGCSPSSSVWDAFADGRRWYRVPGESGWQSRPRATAASGVLGTSSPDTEYLYVSGPMARPDAEDRIRVVQIGPDLGVRRAEYVPEHYPSTHTRGPVAIIAAKSAFLDANYLYLTWADRETAEVQISIVQTWDDDDGSETWFTRSARMGIAVLDGPSWSGGVPPSDRSSVMLVGAVAPDGALRYTFLYGRY